MIDGGSRFSALAAQAAMLNEVLRSFASVDFSLAPEPPRSPNGPTSADAPPARAPAVTAGALAAARDDGTERELPPAERGTAAPAGGTDPARSLDGLRPPTLVAPGPAASRREGPSSRSPPGTDAMTGSDPDGATAEAPRAAAGHERPDLAAVAPMPTQAAPRADDPFPGALPAPGAVIASDSDGPTAGRPRVAAEPGPSSAQPAPEEAQSAWRPGDDTVPATPAAFPPVVSKASPGEVSDARRSTADAIVSTPSSRDEALPLETARPFGPARRDGTAAAGTRESRDDGARRPDSPAGEDYGAGVPATEVRDAAAPLPVIRHAAVADIDLRFFSDAASGAAFGDRALDLAGPAAMLVFNAAMIPGWPPPRPFEMPSAEEMLNRLTGSPSLAGREDEMADRLGLPTLAGAALKRLRRLPRSRRLRALLGLTALMDTIETVIEAVEGELLELARARSDDEDWTEAGARRQLTA